MSTTTVSDAEPAGRSPVQPKNIFDETLVAFRDGHKLPGRPSRQQLYRWSEHGMRHKKTRQFIYLSSCVIGGSTYTSVEAYRRFMVAQNAGTDE